MKDATFAVPSVATFTLKRPPRATSSSHGSAYNLPVPARGEDVRDAAESSKVVFPVDEEERSGWKGKNGKAPSAYQWAVFDALCTIPLGRVMTYDGLTKLVGQGSSLGGALKANPFSPRVPCHRVLKSDLSPGGFFGETDLHGSELARKLNLLAQEGVGFMEVQGKGTGKAGNGKVRLRESWRVWKMPTAEQEKSGTVEEEGKSVT